MGKIAISFEKDTSLVRVLPVPAKYDTKFFAKKTYVLSGCLGGIGLSISKWMMKQGAHSVSGPIGGVVQAAMGLDESIWTSMANTSWHTSVAPKVPEICTMRFSTTHHLSQPKASTWNEEASPDEFEGTIPTLDGPGTAVLASSLDGESDLHSKKTDAGLPSALAATLETAGCDEETVRETMTIIVVQRLANLILVPAANIERNMALMKWGMDSMLAAEFRTWFFIAFSVDVPFLLLLGNAVTPNLLGKLVMRDMLAAGRFSI
ncbi:hypothetical protein G7Y79_00033g068380 [Physcia stellaris]|nr:hypothetical protein G7Y79_00033g068380 [Physcia stellaris]